MSNKELTHFCLTASKKENRHQTGLQKRQQNVNCTRGGRDQVSEESRAGQVMTMPQDAETGGAGQEGDAGKGGADIYEALKPSEVGA